MGDNNNTQNKLVYSFGYKLTFKVRLNDLCSCTSINRNAGKQCSISN